MQLPDREELVDAVLGASRALMAVTARALATIEADVTLAQYRVLIELATCGPLRLADLAAALDVDRSATTRMAERLVRKRLVHRRRITSDRRGVRLSLTAEGRELVRDVSRRRRSEIGDIVERMQHRDTQAAIAALRSFADATGEVAEHRWSLGSDSIR